MDSFGSMEDDLLKDTFDLLDDIQNSGFDWRKMKLFSMPTDKFFETPFFTRERARKRGEKFSSFPRYSTSGKKSTTDSSETDSGDEVFSSQSFRRSDSTYSTSSYDTNSSNETLSDVPLSRKPSSQNSDGRRQIPVQHIRTSSQTSNQDLSKKLENQFLNEERHSMPHEIYSDCDRDKNDNYRPRSVPPKTDDPNITNSWKSEGSSFKCFPSQVMESRDIPIQVVDKNDNISQASSSTAKSNNNRVTCEQKTKPPEPSSNPQNQGEFKSRSLPDVLHSGATPPAFRSPSTIGFDKGDNPPWEKRQERIEGALKWLRSELGLLRAQDKVLLSQLKRCQDTIEVIKKQREENSLPEDEEESHWEDWEIAEFDRRCENGEIIDDLSPPEQSGSSPPVVQDIQVQI